MPSASEKQRKFMGADLARLRAGKKTRSGMSEPQLRDFAVKPHGGFQSVMRAKKKKHG